MMGETIWKAANRELLVQSSSIGDKPAWLRNGPHHSYSCVAIQMPLSWGLEQLCNEYRSKASCTIWVKISKILESSWDESRQHDLRVHLRLVSFPCAIDQKVPWIAETFTNHLLLVLETAKMHKNASWKKDFSGCVMLCLAATWGICSQNLHTQYLRLQRSIEAAKIPQNLGAMPAMRSCDGTSLAISSGSFTTSETLSQILPETAIWRSEIQTSIYPLTSFHMDIDCLGSLGSQFWTDWRP